MKSMKKGIAWILALTMCMSLMSFTAFADDGAGDGAASYTVTFDAAGGAGEMAPITVAAGKSVTLPACAYERPEEYTRFGGWQDADKNAYQVGDSITPEADMILTAQWLQDIWTDHVTTDDPADYGVVVDESEKTVTVYSALGLAWVAKMTNDAVASWNHFIGWTVKLGADIDLADKVWAPIGKGPASGYYETDSFFGGSFDGCDHTVFHLHQNVYRQDPEYVGDRWTAHHFYGLFGLFTGASLKNLTVDGAYIFVEYYNYGIAAVVGSIYTSEGSAAEVAFDHITVRNCDLNGFNAGCACIVGTIEDNNAAVNEKIIFTNINAENTNILNPTYTAGDTCIGGVVGYFDAYGEITASVKFENCEIAAQLMPINDCMMHYDYWRYRNAGMLIGGMWHIEPGADGVDLTPYIEIGEKVNVIYRDAWSHQHYCQFANIGPKSSQVRVDNDTGINHPATYTRDGKTSIIGDINQHYHVDGEEHNFILLFDQLIGASTGGKALRAIDGVNVTYHADANSVETTTADNGDTTTTVKRTENGSTITTVTTRAENGELLAISETVEINSETTEDNVYTKAVGSSTSAATKDESLNHPAVATSSDIVTKTVTVTVTETDSTVDAAVGEAVELTPTTNTIQSEAVDIASIAKSVIANGVEEEDEDKNVAINVTLSLESTLTDYSEAAAVYEAAPYMVSEIAVDGKEAVTTEKEKVENADLTAPVTVKLPVPTGYASAGDTITIKHESEGYETAYIPVTVKAAEDGSLYVEFTVEHFSTFSLLTSAPSVTPRRSRSTTTEQKKELVAEEEPAQSLPTRYVDVAENTWYHEAVNYVTARGLMNGVGEQRFSPESKTTRGMVATVLMRLADGEIDKDNVQFSDVKDDAYYRKAAVWAAENNVFRGYGDGLFRGDEDISREQFATVLYRYAAANGVDVSAQADLSAYTDGASVGGFAKEAMAWAVSVGILKGIGNSTLDAQGNATRAQLAEMLTRYIKLTEATA